MLKFRRFISLFLVLVILGPMVAQAELYSYDIGAWGAIAIDGDTGEVLFEKNPDKMLVPASITKVMTTYIIFEEMEAGRLSKDSMIRVSDRVARISRDKSYPMAVPLASGGEYSVDQFIKLIMIPSASASCIAVAEHISGSEEAFVERMNQTAKRMGMEADFKNSHGAKPHYTTARSLAILVKNFIDDYPDILNYTSLQKISFNGRTYRILNKLLHSKKYEGVDGFKTGTISQARYCLASTGTREGRRVISIVLGSPSDQGRYSDSKKILDQAFKIQAERDQARRETQMEFINLKEEGRSQVEYKARLAFSKVDRPYRHQGRLYLDGELLREFDNVDTREGLELYTGFIAPNKPGQELVLSYEMDLGQGEKKVVTRKMKLSEEGPALYKDLDNPDLEKRLAELADLNIMKGFLDGSFGYDRPSSRGDFITILGRLVEARGLDEIHDGPSIYKDVAREDYYNKYLIWAREKNLAQGFDSKFMPKDHISIEEAGKILADFLVAYDIELEDRDKDLVLEEDLSSWARDYKEIITSKPLVDLEDGASLNPRADLKRGDLVSLLEALITSLEEGEEVEEVKEVEEIEKEEATEETEEIEEVARPA